MFIKPKMDLGSLIRKLKPMAAYVLVYPPVHAVFGLTNPFSFSDERTFRYNESSE